MELSFFVKKDGNCEMFAVECAVLPDEIVAKQSELTAAGYELSSAAEYEAQLLNGAKAGMVPQADLDAAMAKINELAGKSTDEGASV